MIYSNKNNFPDYLFRLLTQDDYDHNPGTISATTLKNTPKQYFLSKRHWNSLEIDVEKLMKSVFGTAIHAAFERIEIPNSIKEERLFAVIINDEFKPIIKKDDKFLLYTESGTTEIDPKQYDIITGKFDRLLDMDKQIRMLLDFKSTSVYSYIYQSKIEDWIEQLSNYKLLGNLHGYSIGNIAKILYVFTDWSSSAMKKQADYPPFLMFEQKIKLWDDDQTKKHILNKLKELHAVEHLADDMLPSCKDEDLWKVDDVYEVRRGDHVFKLCTSKLSAEVYINMKGLKDVEINVRYGKVKRCEFCNAKSVCKQYIEFGEKGMIEDYLPVKKEESIMLTPRNKEQGE